MCGHPRVQNSKKNAGIRELEVGGDCLMCQVLHAAVSNLFANVSYSRCMTR